MNDHYKTFDILHSQHDTFCAMTDISHDIVPIY